MHFTAIATALALATVAQSFVVPSTANGVYAVTIGEDGKEVHTKLSDSTISGIQSIEPSDVTTARDLSDLERRDNDQIWCGCGHNMNARHTDKAVNKLLGQLSGFHIIKPKMSFYSIESDVVAFACNRDPDSGSVILPDGYRREIGRITATCGRYIAGATQAGDDGSALLLGYARWKKGDDFCADATSSPSSSC